MTTDTGWTFDLTGLYDRVDRRIGPLVIYGGLAFLGVTFGAALYVWTLRFLLPWVSSARSASDLVGILSIPILGIGALSVLAWLAVSSYPLACRIVLTRDYVSFEFPSGRSWKQGWKDPGFFLRLASYTPVPPSSAGGEVYVPRRPRYPLPPEAVALLVSLAREHGLSIATRPFPGASVPVEVVTIRGVTG
jgi:hypothetical protein